MIHSTLEGSARYEGLHPLFKEAFDYIKTHDFLALESQRIELRDEDLHRKSTSHSKLTKSISISRYYSRDESVSVGFPVLYARSLKPLTTRRRMSSSSKIPHPATWI